LATSQFCFEVSSKTAVNKQNIKNLSALSSMFCKCKIIYCHSDILKPQQIKCQGEVDEYIKTEPKLETGKYKHSIIKQTKNKIIYIIQN